MVRTVVFLLLLRSIIAPLPAAAADPWLRIQTDHFELYTTAGERTGRDAILYFEQLRSFFRQIMQQPLEGGNELPVRIFAFRNEKEFAPFRPRESTAGYFLPGPDRNSIVLMKASQEFYPAVIHEYVHLLVNSLMGPSRLPVWLNEGYAELFSTLKPIGKQVRVGDFLPGRLQHLQQSKWIPLDALLAADHKSPYYNEKDRVGVFYAQSWLLTHMLMLDDDYRPKFADFLNKLPSGAEHALLSVYGRDLKKITADLQSYARTDRIKVGLFDVKLNKAAEVPRIEPADPTTVAVALANLEIGTGKRAQAKARLQSVNAQGRWDVPESLGYLEWMEGRHETAITHMADAIAAGCPNAKLYADYARLIASANQPAAKVLNAFEQAVQRNPNELELRLYAAHLQIQQKRHFQALASLGQVKAVKPEFAGRFFRTLSWAQYLSGQKEDALKNAIRARQHTTAPADLVSLEQFITYLQNPQPQRPATPASAFSTDERPTLRRDGPRPSGDLDPLPTPNAQSEGTLTQMECLGKQARLHVTTSNGPSVFLIEDPTAITIRSGGQATVEFKCGPQNPPKPIVIEHQPDPSGKAAGIVTALEFP